MASPVIVSATRQLSAAHYSTLPSDSEVRLNPGVLLANGELEIVSEVGRGGVAVVYRAVDRTSDREVALKIGVAKADERRTQLRFHKEHRIGLMLGEFGLVVRPLRVGVLSAPVGFENRPYLVTELVEGKPLDIIMAVHRHGLDLRRACAIGRDIGEALATMHARGIIHRDIKPGNVLVSDDGNQGSRLIDFELAYVRGDDWAEPSSDQTREASVSGTALYMAPEQVLGHCPAPSADIYAYGAMLYEIFSGNPPHDRLPYAELLARKCDRTRSPISIRRMRAELEPRLAGLIDQCLRYDPSERPTASELVTAFADFLVTTPPPPPQGEQRPTRDHSALVMILLVVSSVAVTTIVSLLLAWPEQGPGASSPELSSSPPPGASLDPALAVAGPSVPATISGPPATPGPPSKASPVGRRTSRPTTGARPSSARSVSASRKANDCPTTVSKAKRAAVERRWGRVLHMTNSKKCWTGEAASQRALLRTQAYFETGRDADCVRSGRGSTDPQVARWVRVCEAKSKESHK